MFHIKFYFLPSFCIDCFINCSIVISGCSLTIMFTTSLAFLIGNLRFVNADIASFILDCKLIFLSISSQYFLYLIFFLLALSVLSSSLEKFKFLSVIIFFQKLCKDILTLLYFV